MAGDYMFGPKPNETDWDHESQEITAVPHGTPGSKYAPSAGSLFPEYSYVVTKQSGWDQARQRYQGLAGSERAAGAAAQGRNAVGADYGQAETDRFNQGEMYRLMRDRAHGTAPSVAQMEGDRNAKILAAQQASMAAAARGPAGLAMAQSNAAASTAAGQQAIAGNAMVAAARERAEAEQAAFGAATQMGGQAASRAQFQAQLLANQRQQNDQYDLARQQLGLAYERTGFDVSKARLERDMDERRIMAGAAESERQRDWQEGENFWDRLTSDIRAKTDIEPMNTAPEQAGGPMDGGGIIRDNPYGAYSSAIAPESAKAASTYNWQQAMANSSGTGGGGALGSLAKMGLMAAMSDARAKQEAFQLGAQQGGMSPEEAKKAYGALSRVAGQKTKGQGSEGNNLAASQAAMFRAAGPMQQYSQQDGMTKALATGLQPYAYQYKPGMGPGGQNVGPMAQNMAANPVTSTAVYQDPNTGMMALDRDKSLKLAMGGVGHVASKQDQLQQQADALQAQMNAMYNSKGSLSRVAGR